MVRNVLRSLFGVFLVLCVALPAYAGEALIYKHDDVTLEGYVALPDQAQFSGKRPVVLVVHQWKGLGEYEKRRADMLADLGYVAFAIDVYGQGVRPDTTEAAGAESGKYKGDPALARARLMAALNQVGELAGADTDKVAIIGYCFGGTMALELARSGADIDAAVSFHGGLGTQAKAEDGAIKASVQIHHGADDPYVPAEEVAAFVEEMNTAQADWHMVSYADAVHSFTEKEAGDDPSKGVAYNEKADERSWAYTLNFLETALQ
jgi:dienelactone hydrolase